MAKQGRLDPRSELARLSDNSGSRQQAMMAARQQLNTIAKVAVGVVIVSWLLALSFWSGLESTIPFYIAGVVTVVIGVLAFLVKRNLGRSEELGALLGGADLPADERARRIEKLTARVEKGEHAAILAKAQLLMHDDPKNALEVLEGADLSRGQKMMINQVRGMRCLLHLNFGEVKAARDLAEEIELKKMVDLATRANLAGAVAEAWARTGNPIEADELLDGYDPDDKRFRDIKVQLLRARAFSSAHRNDIPRMRKVLKGMTEISPQLLSPFVGGKRIHPLLQKEAKKLLERSGAMPRPKIQMVRR